MVVRFSVVFIMPDVPTAPLGVVVVAPAAGANSALSRTNVFGRVPGFTHPLYVTFIVLALVAGVCGVAGVDGGCAGVYGCCAAGGAAGGAGRSTGA